MPRPYVRVRHLAHGDEVIGTYTPIKPRFAFRTNDPGDLTYGIALSNEQLTRDAFAPKRTDFHLQVSADGAAWQNIMGGFIMQTGISSETGVVNVQCSDWMEYLNQPYWFDSYNYNGTDLVAGTGGRTQLLKILEDPDNFARAWIGTPGIDTDLITYNATQQIVIRELLDNLNLDEDGMPIGSVFAGDGTGWTEVMNYLIMLQDETSILEHIRAISNLSDPYGFDFFMNWDRTLVFYNPTRTAAIDDINTIYTITRTQGGLVKLEWQNNGPTATHTVGLGAGQPGLWAKKTFAPSREAYRRWLRLVNLGDAYSGAYAKNAARMAETIESATDGIPDRFPQKDLKITLKPDEVDPTDPTAFFHPLVGEALYVDVDFPRYHRIFANFWITAQEFYTDDEGNWQCDVSLEQIYDPSGIG